LIVEIVFAAGCFWGVEKHFDHFDGVIKAESGYVGGNYANPTYDDVLKYRHLKDGSKIVNYTEGVKVTFDNSKVKAKTLIKSFWELHNPTQLNAQGNDIGNNYRSAIFYTNATQEANAKSTKVEYQNLLIKNGYGKIVTEIKPLVKFYNAEESHQDYLAKNPFGYCPNHATGVKFSSEDLMTQDDIVPFKGKEIIVIKSENYCPYCEKFEADVSSRYKGTLPLRTVFASQLKGFKLETKIFATPTILFIENSKEVIGYVGYMDSALFYKTLGVFKLGKDSKAYQVAFHEGTDAPGCKQYKIFKDTPDGVFIDKLSGEILFDTCDRFDSRTGWLSFYKSVDGAVIEKSDYSFGMKRVALISKISGIHLGHVFDRADGRKRFCIDATVLEFVPRKEINFFKYE
jgi:peptide methionine sulfoxide reductase msrA/msrB